MTTSEKKSILTLKPNVVLNTLELWTKLATDRGYTISKNLGNEDCEGVHWDAAFDDAGKLQGSCFHGEIEFGWIRAL